MKLIASIFPKAAEVLREAAQVIEDRDADYGDNPVVHAELMELLAGLDPGEVQRDSLFNMIGIKITRYANNLDRGGHDDSLLDLITYAAALLVIDREQRG